MNWNIDWNGSLDPKTPPTSPREADKSLLELPAICTKPALGLERLCVREVLLTHVIRVCGMRYDSLFLDVSMIFRREAAQTEMIYPRWYLLSAEYCSIRWHDSW